MSVMGLVDTAILAELTGAKPATIRYWNAKRKAGEAHPSWLPAPIGALNGGAVWRLSDFGDMDEIRATISTKPGPRPKADVSGRADTDETAYLLSSPANASHLDAAIEQHRRTQE